MKYILVLALGILIGHYGIIYVSKWTMNAGSTVLNSAGKVLDTANKVVK